MFSTVKNIFNNERMWMHVPVGVISAVLMDYNGTIGLSVWFGFLVYEIWQSVCIRDQAYKDIIGGLVGLAGAGLALLVRSMVF